MLKKKNLKIKTGIMGGSFNPFHLAHLNSLLTVKEKFSLDNVIVMPSFETPLKKTQELEAEPSHRLKMLRQSLKSYSFILVDDQEIRRKGISYTYISLAQHVERRPTEELFFIMGLDQFQIFDRWKNFVEILKQTNLIITSRPGTVFPKKKSEIPKKLKPLVEKITAKEMTLKESDKKIYFCRLEDMDISSSNIRKQCHAGKKISHLVPKTINLYIQKKELYQNSEKKITQGAKELLKFCMTELEEKKAYDIQGFDLLHRPIPFSYGLIASGSNTKQTKAIALHLKQKVKEKFGMKTLNEEGFTESRWIVLDYGDLMIHIFYEHTKQLYKLAEIWEEPPSLT